MISGARPVTIPDAVLDPAPELEVILTHQPLTLRSQLLG
jgi:hypothetical protein